MPYFTLTNTIYPERFRSSVGKAADPSYVREAFWMSRCSAVVSCVLGHGFPPPLNPAVEITTCTLRTGTDSYES